MWLYENVDALFPSIYLESANPAKNVDVSANDSRHCLRLRVRPCDAVPESYTECGAHCRGLIIR